MILGTSKSKLRNVIIVLSIFLCVFIIYSFSSITFDKKIVKSIGVGVKSYSISYQSEMYESNDIEKLKNLLKVLFKKYSVNVKQYGNIQWDEYILRIKYLNGEKSELAIKMNNSLKEIIGWYHSDKHDLFYTASTSLLNDEAQYMEILESISSIISK